MDRTTAGRLIEAIRAWVERNELVMQEMATRFPSLEKDLYIYGINTFDMGTKMMEAIIMELEGNSVRPNN